MRFCVVLVSWKNGTEVNLSIPSRKPRSHNLWKFSNLPKVLCVNCKYYFKEMRATPKERWEKFNKTKTTPEEKFWFFISGYFDAWSFVGCPQFAKRSWMCDTPKSLWFGYSHKPLSTRFTSDHCLPKKNRAQYDTISSQYHCWKCTRATQMKL